MARRSLRRTIEDYFREEYDHLMRRGRQFAAEHEGLMPFFREYDRHPDPHVDRVLEGVAYLTAKLTKAFDDNRGQLAVQLLRAFWPQFLRPMPSLTILQFRPRPATSAPYEVPGGTIIESRELSRKRSGATRIKYATAAPVVVNPLRIEQVRLSRARGRDYLHVRFRVINKAALGDLDLARPLPVQLHDQNDYHVFQAFLDLRIGCRRGLGDVEVRVPPDAAEPLPGRARIRFVDPLGRPPVLPGAPVTFPGFRVLQEFFLLPTRFLGFEVEGLELLAEHEDADGFELRIPFDSGWQPRHAWSRETLQLHCVPAANLFPGPCEAMTYTGERRRVALLPDETMASREGAALHSVGEVILRRRSDRSERVLKECDFSQYGMLGGDGARRPEPSYSLDYEYLELDGGPTQRVFLLLRDVETPTGFADSYTLSVQAYWVDADVNPYLKEIQVSQGAPEPVTCTNLVAPTPYVPALEPSWWQWKLVDVMALNYASIQRVEGFRNLLRIFNTGERARNDVYHQSLMEMSIQHRIFWERRTPINGLHFEFTVADSQFPNGRGQLVAFYDVVHSFLTHYASINSKVSMSVVLNDSEGERLELWPAAPGSRIVL
jgi:type VI secretion system protein ImpG